MLNLTDSLLQQLDWQLRLLAHRKHGPDVTVEEYEAEADAFARWIVSLYEERKK